MAKKVASAKRVCVVSWGGGLHERKKNRALCCVTPRVPTTPVVSSAPRSLRRTLVLPVKAFASRSDVVAKQPPAAAPGHQCALAQCPILHLPAPDGRLRAGARLHRSSTRYQPLG